MTRLRRFALLFALISSAAIARANTITYNLSGVTTSAGALTGTLAVDSATDRVTSADLVLNDPEYGSPTFNFVSTSASYNGLTQTYIADSSIGRQNYGGQIALFFNTADIGSGSLSICTVSGACGTQGVEPSSIQIYSTHGNVSLYLNGGSLSPAGATTVALTPEPSGLFLLGTGILAVAGMLLFWPSKRGVRPHQAHLQTSA